MRAEVVAQPLHGVEARCLVEVVVHQHQIGQPAEQHALLVDILERAGRADVAAPAREQAAHGVQHFALIVDAEDSESGEICTGLRPRRDLRHFAQSAGRQIQRKA